MRKTIQITALPEELHNDESVKNYLQRFLGVSAQEISGFTYQKKSIDARKKPVRVNLQLEVFLNETPQNENFDFGLN